MNDFEIIYQTDPSRESDSPREKHPSIELSDHEYLKIKESQQVKVSICEPISEEDLIMNKNVIEESKIIKKDKKDEKGKSKTTKRKLKKINPKVNKSAMEKI